MFYTGKLVKGRRHDYGSLINQNDGSKYEGLWVDDVKSGRGIITFEDGRKYNGEW